MDLYVVLGVEHGATESEIKRAYRRLARRFHPDINPGDHAAEARFRQILEAYETLVDPSRRSRYDLGQGPAADARLRSEFEGFDFTARGADYSATFGDLVAEVLSERGTRPAVPQRGEDLHHELQLSFEEAFHGVERALTFPRRDTCTVCRGSGRVRMATGPCRGCHGSGSVRSVRGHMVFSHSCTACDGTGQQRPRACETCAGSGQESRRENVTVTVPAGTADGARIRVAGAGNAGGPGAPAGDLYVTVRVEPHPVYRRDGNDVHMSVPIAVHEAALGARVEIATPDGAARLRVPPGTQSGQRFRLRERGAHSPRGGPRGDLVVEVRLMLPKILDERSKELLREFGRINGENVRG
jgi:molecular chaperone DnaJ